MRWYFVLLMGCLLLAGCGLTPIGDSMSLGQVRSAKMVSEAGWGSHDYTIVETDSLIVIIGGLVALQPGEPVELQEFRHLDVKGLWLVCPEVSSAYRVYSDVPRFRPRGTGR